MTENNTVWVHLQHTPLALAQAYEFLSVPAAGGLALFVGTTRQWTGSQVTVRLEYEAYEPMAAKEMHRIAAKARARWPMLLRVCLIHRLSSVPVQEASVITGVAAAHRAPAFEACRFLIDMLKQSVPIWKREFFADGTVTWVGTEPQPRAPM